MSRIEEADKALDDGIISREEYAKIAMEEGVISKDEYAQVSAPGFLASVGEAVRSTAGQTPDVMAPVTGALGAINQTITKAATAGGEALGAPVDRQIARADKAIAGLVPQETRDLLSVVGGPAVAVGIEKAGESVFRNTPGGETAKRHVGAFGAGAVSSAGGTASWLARETGFKELGTMLHTASQETVKNMMPPDPTVSEKVAMAGGSLAGFMLPGFGVMYGAGRIGTVVQRLAPFLGTSLSSVMEAGVEGEAAYREMLEKTGDEMEAKKAGSAAFWLNLPLVGFTNKFTMGFGEKKIFLKALENFLTEGTQEASQEVIGALATNDPITAAAIAEAGLIGGLVGGGMGAGQAMIARGQSSPQVPAEQQAPGVPGDAATARNLSLDTTGLPAATPGDSASLNEKGVPGTEVPSQPPQEGSSQQIGPAQSSPSEQGVPGESDQEIQALEQNLELLAEQQEKTRPRMPVASPYWSRITEESKKVNPHKPAGFGWEHNSLFGELHPDLQKAIREEAGAHKVADIAQFQTLFQIKIAERAKGYLAQYDQIPKDLTPEQAAAYRDFLDNAARTYTLATGDDMIQPEILERIRELDAIAKTPKAEVKKPRKGPILPALPKTPRQAPPAGSPPKSGPAKRVIEEESGVRDTSPEVKMTEAKLLRLKYLNQEKGAKIGARHAAQETKGRLMEEFRYKFGVLKEQMQEKVQDAVIAGKQRLFEIQEVKQKVFDYVTLNLPQASRGKFMAMLRDAKTPRDAVRVLLRVDAEASTIYKKSLISDIRKRVSRALDSGSVAIEDRRRIEALISTIELKGHSPESIAKLKATQAWIDAQKAAGKDVEMPAAILEKLKILGRKPIDSLSEDQLEIILDQLIGLETIGKTRQRVKEDLYNIQKSKVLNEVVGDAVPLERNQLLTATPGESLTVGQKLSNVAHSIANWFQDKELAITPPDVVFDMASRTRNYAGAMFKQFKGRMDAAISRWMVSEDELKTPVIKLAQSLGLNDKNMERIMVHATRVQGGGIKKLMDDMGITEKQIDSINLSPAEMQVYLKMREVIESQYQAVREKLAWLYNRDIGKVENYFPWQTDWDAYSEVEVFQRLGDAIDGAGRRTKTEEQGFTKSRTGGKQAIKLNAMDVFEKHISDVAYFLETQEDVKMLSEIAASPDFKLAAGDTMQAFTLKWLDVMARKGGAKGATMLPLLDWLRQNLGAAVMGFKLSSIFIQPTSMLDAAAKLGGGKVLGALKDVVADKKLRAFLIDNIPELRFRVGDDKAFTELSENAFLEKAQRKSFAALQRMDALSASATALAAYRSILEQKGVKFDLENPDPDAIQEASLILRRTQSSPFFKDMSLALSRGGFTGNKSLDKALFQFKSFMLNRWSFIRHDVGRLGLGSEKKEDAAMAAFYLASAAAAESGIRIGTKSLLASVIAGLGLGVKEALDPEDDKFSEQFLLNILQNIPFLGDAFSAAYSKRYYELIPALQPLDKTSEALTGLVHARNEASAIRATVKALEGLGSLFGVPGTVQASQIVRMMISENTIKFPFASERNDLDDKRKKGLITSEEDARLDILNEAENVFSSIRKEYNEALKDGNMQQAQKLAEMAFKEMKTYR